MVHDTARIAALICAAALVAGGLYLMTVWRREGERALKVVLPGVGRVSELTLLVTGLACLWLAYHVAVYTLGASGFRAPAWVALAVGVGSVLASLGVDRLESGGEP